ncbi:892_t:CDS:1, partial [Entrophospora sp. SA101]
LPTISKQSESTFKFVFWKIKETKKKQSKKKATISKILEKESENKKKLSTIKNKITNLELQIVNKSLELEKLNSELIELKNAEEATTKELMIIQKEHEESKNFIEQLDAERYKNESTRRHLHNNIQDLKGNIRVFCRVRPQTPAEKDVPLTDIEYPEKCE